MLRFWLFINYIGLALFGISDVRQADTLVIQAQPNVTVAQHQPVNDPAPSQQKEAIEVVDDATLQLPTISDVKAVVKHTAYTLEYAEPYEQAKWVAYLLTRQQATGGEERSNKFKEDALVKTGSATDADYAKTGYDRGHLAPAADMAWSKDVMQESFFYSNMSPQVPSFNRGVWKRLETLVRKWAEEYDSIYVVTGPILRAGLPTIGANKVAVPEEYYKVVLCYSHARKEGIGFILPNAGSKATLGTYAVSIDEVEKRTGLDFYPSLPDKEEKVIEARLCIPCWKFYE